MAGASGLTKIALALGVGAVAATAVATGTSAVAGAAPPPCTAAELSSVVSGVTAQAAQFLEAHPDANDVLTQAGSQPPQTAKATVRGYFVGHPDQFLQLQGIAQPLIGMRSRCNASVSIGQVANLLDALQE
ncbi:MAG: heme-binding protein [Mycobacterium sp.]|jgi:hemophore-related protein|nr:heme-binding protein [Mycobacterium sp.]